MQLSALYLGIEKLPQNKLFYNEFFISGYILNTSNVEILTLVRSEVTMVTARFLPSSDDELFEDIPDFPTSSKTKDVGNSLVSNHGTCNRDVEKKHWPINAL